MITSEVAKKLFVSESLVHARSLPMREAEIFLKGLLLIAGDSVAIDSLSDAHDEIRTLNERMEKLQITLDLK